MEKLGGDSYTSQLHKEFPTSFFFVKIPGYFSSLHFHGSFRINTVHVYKKWLL